MMDIRFAFPLAQLPLCLSLFGLVMALIMTVLARLEKQHRARLHRFVEAPLAPRLMPGYTDRMRRPLYWLAVTGFAFLGLAFMQPRWGRDWVEVERGSRDMLVLLDTSESMAATDIAPDRLERARQKIRGLLALFPGDRFGLIAFSGGAALQCPLTLDHGYLQTVLSAVGTDTLSAEGTDIADALTKAHELFEQDIRDRGEENRHNRAVILLSDGETVSGDAVSAAKRLGRAAPVSVIGIGRPEGAEVRFSPDYLSYANSSAVREPHHSRLDEKTLSNIALEGRGVYVRATADNRDVAYIQRELETVRELAVSGELRFSLVNRYRWPLAGAVLCFLAEGCWLALLPFMRNWRLRREGEKGFYDVQT
jgi:Ca-activated chloride channel homolog